MTSESFLRAREALVGALGELEKLRASGDAIHAIQQLDMLDSLLRESDLSALADAMLPDSLREEPSFRHDKYVRIPTRVANVTQFAIELGLRETADLDILDLGAGGGFFCWVVSTLGHRAVAVEPPADGQTPGLMFAPLITFLGVPHSGQWIAAKRPIARDDALQPGRRFDLITAFAINFNSDIALATESISFWSADDYRFLLRDLRDNFLKPNGRVLLHFNEPIYGETATPLTPPTVARYYTQLGDMLRPFLISYSPSMGSLLDLSRAAAWRDVEAAVLTPPASDETTLETWRAYQAGRRKYLRKQKRRATTIAL